MMQRLSYFLAVLFLTTPVHAFTAQNGLGVNQAGNGFIVPWRGRSAAADFWCAAGDYVIRGLNQSPTTRIFRVTDRPRRAGEPMAFSLNPGDTSGSTGIFTLIGAQDGAMSAAMAQSYCEITRKGRRHSR